MVLAGGQRFDDEGGDLVHEPVGLPRVQHAREPAHGLAAGARLHPLVPVVHDPALPPAVGRVRGRERHVERAPARLAARRLAHPRRHRHHRVPRPRGRAGADAAAEQHGEEVVRDQERPRRHQRQHQRRPAAYAAAAASGLPHRRVHLSSPSGPSPSLLCRWRSGGGERDSGNSWRASSGWEGSTKQMAVPIPRINDVEISKENCGEGRRKRDGRRRRSHLQVGPFRASRPGAGPGM